MTCRATRDFGTRSHTCECRAKSGHETSHDCRCGRSWWNTHPKTEPYSGAAYVDGYAYVEGKGYVPRGKAYAYQALGLTVDWGYHQHGPDKDTRILQYKDDTTEGD